MKCKRCGKEFKDSVEVCDACGYEFKEGERESKLLDSAKDPEYPNAYKQDLIDFPILAFIFSILGLLVPIFILSFLAIRFSKKPAKASLVPFSRVGFVFGILGLVVSLLCVSMILILFMKG